jgi:hypothetical protein
MGRQDLTKRPESVEQCASALCASSLRILSLIMRLLVEAQDAGVPVAMEPEVADPGLIARTGGLGNQDGAQAPRQVRGPGSEIADVHEVAHDEGGI